MRRSFSPRRLVLGIMVMATATGAAVLPTEPATSQTAPAPYRIVWDDFRSGFTTGPDGRWEHVTVGPFVADDGRVSTSSRGLNVRAGGTNPATGQPAFVRTMAQEDENGTGLPGAFDHMKWLAYISHTASSGFEGFDAVPGQELSCETWLSGRTYGTAGHPFGSAVSDHDDDLRLANVGMSVIDPDTLMVFDFFLSNDRIYAGYERLPYARDRYGDYAGFVHTIPLARRRPGDTHHFRIAYDRSAGVVRWLLDEREVFRVDRLGHRLDRSTLTLDHGGVDTLVEPRQLNCGMGMYTVLDGSYPTGQALVRLSTAPDFYYRPEVGEPAPQSFVDDESLAASRLFGQGASFCVRRYVVSSQPSQLSSPTGSSGSSGAGEGSRGGA